MRGRTTDELAAFEAQSQAWQAWVEHAPDDVWGRPSSLPGWTLHALLAHVTIVHESFARALAMPSPLPAVPVAEYVARYSPHAEDLAQASVDRAAEHGPGELLSCMRAAVAVAGARVGSAPVVLTTGRGPVERPDYIATRVLELVVHADDVHRSDVGPGPLLDAAAQARAVDLLVGIAGPTTMTTGSSPRELLRALTGRSQSLAGPIAVVS